MKKEEFKCRTCSGHGEVDIGWWHCQIIPCGNCGGTGKVDWIRNVMPLHYNETMGKWE